MLLAPPPVAILFVLAGWWERYRFVPIIAGVTVSILSLALLVKDNRTRNADEPGG